MMSIPRTVEGNLERFTLIYGTETVFDSELRRIIPLNAVRNAVGRDLFRMWQEHAYRRTVLPEQVVFDPCGEHDPATTCNLWGGWPTKPQKGSCELLLELLEYLCSNEDNPREVYVWLLCWLAYPLRHHGTKMQTAVLIHGPEGTGKNTFFGAIRQIYDRYGGTFDQVQLESQFNGWTSGKLFMIGNEVVTRAELYHQQGRMKTMITEREWQINEKNLPTRPEQNHCNFVFFSNRIDIAKLDRDDRRYCVIWTPAPREEEFYTRVADEIRAGGAAALHHYLLNELDLGDFGPHTKPPITRAKRDLINLSLDSTDRFFLLWSAGRLPVPYTPVRSEDLYSAYRHWAAMEGVPKPAPSYVLLGGIGKKAGVEKKRVRHYAPGTSRITQSMAVIPNTESVPSDGAPAWFQEKFEEFTGALSTWKGK